MRGNPHDKETGTDVKGANIWNDSYAARLLRVIWESPDGVPQSVLMNMHYDLGMEAGGRKSKNKSSFQNTWERLLKEANSWSGPRFYVGSRFDRPLAQRSVDGKNFVVWTGPSQEEWLASMSAKELTAAHGNMERQMTKYDDPLDATWVRRLENEMETRTGGGGMRKNPGEVEIDESFSMSAGRYYAQRWTTLQLGSFPTDEEFTVDLVGSIDVVSDMMKSGRRAEAYDLAFDVVESLTGKVEANAWDSFKTMNVVLVGNGRIIRMWDHATDDGWGDIGVEMMIQRWITSNYGDGYTFDGVEPTLALMHYRAELDKMIEFANAKAWQPYSPKHFGGSAPIREWRKSDNGTRGTSVWWWSDDVHIHLASRDRGLEHEDFTIGFVMGIAQWLDKNASLYRKAPGMKQNPGELRDDESFDMKGGRFIAFDVHSGWSISLKGADKANDLALVRSIIEPLSIASDTIEQDPTAVDLAYDLIEQALEGALELQELNDHAVEEWLGPKTVMAYKGKIVGVVPYAYRDVSAMPRGQFVAAPPMSTYLSNAAEQQSRMVAFADSIAKPGWSQHPISGTKDDGPYLLEMSKTQPDPLRADIYTMKFHHIHGGDEYTGAEATKAHKQFMLGYWMEALRVVRKMKKAKPPKENPGEPTDDMSWTMKAGRMQGVLDWDGHLPLSPEMRAELEAASDALETGDPKQRLRAIKILLRVEGDPWALSGDIDSPRASEPGFVEWLNAETVLIKNRQVDDKAKIVYSGDIALVSTTRWPASENEIGAYMEDVGLTYRDALAETHGHSIVTNSKLSRMRKGKPEDHQWHDYLIGYWMAVINFQWQQDMKPTKTKKNPAPLSDKEWWEGVLAKKRKKNPGDDLSNDEIESAVSEHGATNREQRRHLMALLEKARRILADMPPRGQRKFDEQKRADKIDRKIASIKAKLEQHSDLVAELDGHRTNPAVDQNDVADREAAVNMYKTFWRMEPTKIGEFHKDFAIPTKVKEMGKGHSIMYRSLKTDPETLQKPKKPVDYIHHFDAGVHMYGPSSSGGESVPSWITEVTSLTLLGSCLGWEIKVGGKMREAEGVAPLPELYTIPDGRALLVIQDKREVLAVFWGGDLGVEGRGIVH